MCFYDFFIVAYSSYFITVLRYGSYCLFRQELTFRSRKRREINIFFLVFFYFLGCSCWSNVVLMILYFVFVKFVDSDPRLYGRILKFTVRRYFLSCQLFIWAGGGEGAQLTGA
jgi:hypothetical protein